MSEGRMIAHPLLSCDMGDGEICSVSKWKQLQIYKSSINISSFRNTSWLAKQIQQFLSSLQLSSAVNSTDTWRGDFLIITLLNMSLTQPRPLRDIVLPSSFSWEVDSKLFFNVSFILMHKGITWHHVLSIWRRSNLNFRWWSMCLSMPLFKYCKLMPVVYSIAGDFTQKSSVRQSISLMFKTDPVMTSLSRAKGRDACMMKVRDTGHHDCMHNKPLKNIQQSLCVLGFCEQGWQGNRPLCGRRMTENIFREQVTKQACRNLGLEMKTIWGGLMFQSQHQD